jgi:iron complex transport system substrate-binding protein
MQKVLVIGANCAWQKVLVFDSFEENKINRAKEIYQFASGKGINFARAMLNYNKFSPCVVQFTGGSSGKELVDYLANEGIENKSISVNGATRTCTTCIDLENKKTTEVIEPSPEAAECQVEEFLTACKSGDDSGTGSVPDEGLSVTDWTGYTSFFEACPERVVAVSGSLGEVWLNAGGELIGTTRDAVTERDLKLDDIAIVGTIKEPDVETILSLEPDFVILSADTVSHPDVADMLREMGIPCGLFHEEYFEDYLSLIKQFTALTGREDLYEENGLMVRQEIQDILRGADVLDGKTVLLLRAYGSGFKAKNAENLAGTMLKDFGLENILDKYDSVLEDISMEEIILTDPDYIFVTVMGSDIEGAISYLENQLCTDPAWASLSAVKSDNYHILPKDLFHYKPNARWADAYEYLARIFAGEE